MFIDNVGITVSFILQGRKNCCGGQSAGVLETTFRVPSQSNSIRKRVLVNVVVCWWVGIFALPHTVPGHPLQHIVFNLKVMEYNVEYNYLYLLKYFTV